MNDSHYNLELNELILSALDDLEGSVAGSEKFARLQEKIKEDPATADYYVEFMAIYSGLCQLAGVSDALKEFYKSTVPNEEKILLDAIERDEKLRKERAAEVARREAEAKKERAKKSAELAYRKFQDEERRRMEKLAYKRYKARQRGLIIGIGGLAASLLLMIVWLILPTLQNTAPVAPPIVATVTQVWAAQWDNPENNLVKGTRLAAAPMGLKRGIVQITFDDGAEVILSAPCKFKLENANQMYLESGTLAATVPKRTIGFTIRTNGATVVDYGTEFGITAHADGETEAHVFKGEVDMRSGSDTRVYKQSRRLKKGEASRVDSKGNFSQEKYKANLNRFVRKMPEGKILSLPGQRLDLSDIVAGGNGFGSAPAEYAINPDTGEQTRGITTAYKAKLDSAYFIGNCQYNLVESTPFIDGVFVPDSSAGPVKVSSIGHLFDNCPDTTGTYYVEVFSTATITDLPQTRCPREFIIRGKPYNNLENPAICMHANTGITFDLKEIRAANPGCRIVSFHALLGIAHDTQGRPLNRLASFWVLVDGQVRFSRPKITAKDGGAYIVIGLNNWDRFLTLIATEGDDKIISHDWCLFAVPTLELNFQSETL